MISSLDMCLILFAWQTHPRYPLVVAANRDEFHDRQLLPDSGKKPRIFWPDGTSRPAEPGWGSTVMGALQPSATTANRCTKPQSWNTPGATWSEIFCSIMRYRNLMLNTCKHRVPATAVSTFYLGIRKRFFVFQTGLKNRSMSLRSVMA